MAMGTNFLMKKGRIGMSMEYFTGIDEYETLSAEPAAFIRPTDIFGAFSSDNFLNVKTATASVFNIALGYEHILSEKVYLTASVSSNMSYYKKIESSGIQTTFSNWDIWHTAFGAIINKERSSLTLGILPSFGNNNRFEQTGDISEESDLFGGATKITKANYFSIGILLGFTYNFKKLE